MEEVQRKLASVQVIAEVAPIPDADAIEKVRVNGWWIVAKKGEFKVGDMCVYCECDSVLPVNEDLEFLRKGCYVQRDWLQLPNNEGFRLRTIKLRKQVSQGLVLPLSYAEKVIANAYWFPEEGDDLTLILNVVKWEPPVSAQLAGQARGNFPSFIRKTDEERIQNLIRDVFENPENMEATWEVTLKLDGSSCTKYHYNEAFGVCSRNIDLKLDQTGNTFVDMFHKLGLVDKLPKWGNIAIQGELMGPSIQGNREKLPDYKYFIFKIWDIDAQEYVPNDRRWEIVSDLGVEHVPVIAEKATLAELSCDTLEKMLAFVNRPSLNHPIAEGAVFKRTDGKFSFKCINNQFLLKEE